MGLRLRSTPAPSLAWGLGSRLLLSSILALVSGPEAVSAWFRVACTTPLVHDRVDPIVSLGIVPSNHIHTVHGASGFSPDASFESLRQSNCTSCEVAEDLSNYWFPRLYFVDPATKQYEPVGDGGLLVYYLNRGEGDKKNGGAGLRAFPPGFRMISGDVASRTNNTVVRGSQEELAQRAIQWSCLRYPDNDGYDGIGFPTTDCESGFNARLHMPACWDGVNTDSPDHRSHVAYLSGMDNGRCPSTHPVPLLKLLYEITWDVHAFSERWKPGRDVWPFIYSTGDPTGFSWHGDFQNGWDVKALQNAIDDCDNPNDDTGSGITEACRHLTVIDASIATTCKVAPITQSFAIANLTQLPGCNPLQYGPDPATIYNTEDETCPLNPNYVSSSHNGTQEQPGQESAAQTPAVSLLSLSVMLLVSLLL